MNVDDLEAITTIDKKVLGQYRPEYWRRKMRLLENDSPTASLVAELDGQVVGFILGEASGWQYGVPETVGHIDTLGVDPEFQGRFLGRRLMKELVRQAEKAWGGKGIHLCRLAGGRPAELFPQGRLLPGGHGKSGNENLNGHCSLSPPSGGLFSTIHQYCQKLVGILSYR